MVSIGVAVLVGLVVFVVVYGGLAATINTPLVGSDVRGVVTEEILRMVQAQIDAAYDAGFDAGVDMAYSNVIEDAARSDLSPAERAEFHNREDS